MAGTVTVTGKVGPNITATAQVLTGVKYFGIDTDNEVLRVNQATGDPTGAGKEFDIGAATTMTVTISGSTYTVTIS